MAENETNPQPENTQEVTNKPDYIQDKFWDKDGSKVNVESLASSYNALEKKFSQKVEDLTKTIKSDLDTEKTNNAPQEYKLNIPDVGPTKINVDKDMEIVQWWEQTAKTNHFTQDQYDQGVKAFVEHASKNLPNPELEMQKLGDNGKARVEAADLWSKKHLSPDAYTAVQRVATTAEGVKAVEELMKLNQATSMPTAQTAIETSPSSDDLRSMLNDPRYYDSAKRDPAYVKRVTELYEKTYKAKQG
jgi:hypothetical protein